jgi:hypothetical protein
MRRAICFALLLAACSKKPTEGGVRLKQVNDSLTSAGFKVDAFQSADPGRFSAQKCTQGQLEGVDTMMCEYGSAEAVALGRKAGEDWIGSAPTGAVLANGNTVLIVADRAHADPNGKTIHKITQAYTKTK